MTRFRPRAVVAVLILMVVVASIAFFAIPARLEAVAPSPDLPKGPALVERGRYLATAADCVACHSVPGGKPYAGGLAFKLPFGTIYSSNITSNLQAGIGRWSDAEFVRAMRNGVAANGQDLYPAFPYTSYTHMSSDDVLAIGAYLRTVRAVPARVTPNELSFPFNQRYLMRGWKLLFMPSGAMRSNPQQSAEWNRATISWKGPGTVRNATRPETASMRSRAARNSPVPPRKAGRLTT